MKRLLMLAAVVIVSLTAVTAQEDAVKAEVDNCKAYAMAYLDKVVEMDESTRKMVDAMVNVYVQSIVRTAMQMPLNDRSKAVYVEIRKNHFQLLGNYLNEDQLGKYVSSLMEDADGAVECIYCDFPKKKDMDHCVFCGHGFE